MIYLLTAIGLSPGGSNTHLHIYTFNPRFENVLPWEVPIAPSGSLFQSVMDLFTKEYFPMSVLYFLALIFQ